MAIKINTYEEAKRLAEQYAASGQAPQRSYTGLSTAIRFAEDAGTQANDIARHQADAIKQAQAIAANFNDAYSRDLSELSNEATNIANQRDYTGLTPAQIAAEQAAFGSRQTDFDRRVSDFNKNYSAFGLEAFKAPTMQAGANGYIEQVGPNGQPVTAALTGVVDKSNELAAANNQQPGTQPTQSSVDRAFSPTEFSTSSGLADLQRNVMGANASALANAEFVNGAFKAFHNRDATAEELKAYVGKPVGASRTEIIGGAQAAGLPTVAPGTVDVPVGIMTPEEAKAQGLQRVLRPDQLSAFRPDQIIRDNRGGIYLNTETTTQAQRDSVQSGVSGNQIGRSDPGIIGDPRVSAVDASNASQTPDPVEFADVMSNTNASAADQAAVITDTATSYIESILGSYNTQLAQYETQLAQRKAEMETLTGRVEAMSTATPNADALAVAKEAEGIREKQAKMVDIQSQIALEQERMQLGIIKEGNKMAPLSILGRRQATVEAQGLARIGALTAIAQVYQGDLSFAMDMVNATVSAMNADRTLQMNALDTLITLKDKQIVQLTDEENAIVEARQKAISDAMASAEKDAERAFDLIKEFPDAALKGGVSLSDSSAVALSKMAPFMAEATTNDTQVIDLGGRKVLIDSATGREIQSYEDTSGDSADGKYKDITKDDGSIVRIFTDDSGVPTGKEIVLATADQTKKLEAFNTDLSGVIEDMKTDAKGVAKTTWEQARAQLKAKYPEVPMDEIDRRLAGNVSLPISSENSWGIKGWRNADEFLSNYPGLKPEFEYWRGQKGSDGKKLKDDEIVDKLQKKYSSNFNQVGDDTNKVALAQLEKKLPAGSQGGQCGRYVNQHTGLKMGDSYESKMAYVDPSIGIPKPGDVFVMPYDWTGHAGFVKEVVYAADGKTPIKIIAQDSNWFSKSAPETVAIHEIPFSSISGFARVPLKLS